MRKLIAVAVLVVLVACGNDGEEGAAEPSPTFTFPIATVLLDNGDESTLVTVEVAETPEQQTMVLSDRDSLADDEGVVFVFFEEREAGFEADEIPVPLSVAYFDARGTVVRIVDVQQCPEDACRVDGPGAPYMGALAVNEGMFDEWDISQGDHVQLTR